MRESLTFLVALCLVSAALHVVRAQLFQSSPDALPNGDRVPNPCAPTTNWPGVGYLSIAGGGALDAFGKDFEAAGSWTAALCRMDSDGDGRTNGEELGDPHCSWTPGSTPERTTGISHPGVCEPLDSPACGSKALPRTQSVPFTTQKQWMDDVCSHHCPSLDATQDVRVHDLRPSPTRIPPKETTYTCATYRFPDVSADYHVIATEPIIDNANVMHHMLVYGCDVDVPVHGPREHSCDFSKCGQLLVAWGVGVSGYCINPMAGIRIGKTGFKYFMIQSHWNNPQEVASWTDNSGVRLYYTPNLRPDDMAMMEIGQRYLNIPPGSTDVAMSSDCTAACTRNLLRGDVYVTLAINHMHLLGIAMSVELLRDGRHVTWITNDKVYHYNSPGFYVYDSPVVVKPGDVLRTTCHYANPHNTTVFYGEGTSEEMCYGFLSFYPTHNMPHKTCTTWKTISNDNCDHASLHGCNPRHWNHFEQSQLYASVMNACDPHGDCRAECRAAIQHAASEEACLRSADAWQRIKLDILRHSQPGRLLLAALDSCHMDGDVPPGMWWQQGSGEDTHRQSESVGINHNNPIIVG